MAKLWGIMRSVPDHGPRACAECGHTMHAPVEFEGEFVSAEDAELLGGRGEVEGCPVCLRTLAILDLVEVGG